MRSGFLFALIAASLLPNLPAQEDDFMRNRFVVILSAYKSFAAAKEDAVRIAKASKVPFSMEGRVYDSRRGLIYPLDFEDELWAGEYVARRYDTTVLPGQETETQYLSVERSDGYTGFEPGYYIVVAGIQTNKWAAQRQLTRFKPWAPTGYVKQTRIYLGCMH